MKRFSDLTIRTKAMLLVAGTTTLALVLSSGLIASYEVVALERALVEDISIMAEIIADNGAAAIAFEDPRFAQKILDAVQVRESVISAAIVTARGDVLASFRRDGENGSGRDEHDPASVSDPEGGFRFLDGELYVSAPVEISGERLGTVFLHSDREEIRRHAQRFAAIAVAIAALSCGLVLLGSSRLLGTMARPLSALAAMAGKVTQEHDFSVRGEKESDDEIGELVGAFNEMLGEIQVRDVALRKSMEETEAAARDLHQLFDESRDLNRKLEREIGERRRAEETLERYRADLERQVIQRTRELARSQEKLHRSERLASVGTLAAGIAHQINNPVGSILNASQYALMCEEDDDERDVWREALARCIDEARRCGRIVRSVLQFSRDEASERWVEDLNGVLSRARGLTRDYEAERRGVLSLQLSDVPLPVEMSPVELEQVFVNLLRNALESLDEGAWVFIRAHRRGDMACVEVQDNGRGIPADQLVHIFDPFFTTRMISGGTGLGLSVGHGIVESHGGSMEVESAPDRGTTFTIELPLARAKAAADAAPAIDVEEQPPSDASSPA